MRRPKRGRFRFSLVFVILEYRMFYSFNVNSLDEENYAAFGKIIKQFYYKN